MQEAIRIGDTLIKAGERRCVELPLPHLYTHAQITMPVYVLHGRQSGPRLFVSAALHGDEINGVEIIRRLIRTKALKTLRGTLLAIPVVNVFGFLNKSRYLPDRRDLNRFFPGYEQGSMTSRLAHLFMEEIVAQCTHGIDLHTAAVGRTNLPQIRADLSTHPGLKGMAQAFSTPVILNASMREGSLRHAASEHSVQTLLYEAGEALRFEEIPIRAGVRGILSVMRHLGILPQKKSAQRYSPLFSHRSRWVRSPQSGILRAVKNMGKFVNENDILGYVADPFGDTEITVRANTSGIIIGRSTLPLVHEGEALFHIADVDEHNADSTLQYFHHEIDPDTDTHSL